MSELNWQELWDEDEQRYRVQTEKGFPARVYTTNGGAHNSPVVGEYLAANMWVLGRWRRDGRSHRYPTLVPEPRTVRRWVNVYRTGDDCRRTGRLYRSVSEARMHINAPDSEHIATVPVEWEE